MQDNWSRSLAMRLVPLVLDGKGRLSDDLVTGLAVRGLLLVDLAVRDRISDAGDAIEVDRQPTGFPPADRLLAAPMETLSALVRQGPADQRDLADEHVQRGTWSLTRQWPHRRYMDNAAEQTKRDKIVLSTNLTRSWDRDDAALAVVALQLGVVSTDEDRPIEAMLQASGSARWLVELTVEEMQRMRARTISWHPSPYG